MISYEQLTGYYYVASAVCSRVLEAFLEAMLNWLLSPYGRGVTFFLILQLAVFSAVLAYAFTYYAAKRVWTLVKYVVFIFLAPSYYVYERYIKGFELIYPRNLFVQESINYLQRVKALPQCQVILCTRSDESLFRKSYRVIGQAFFIGINQGGPDTLMTAAHNLVGQDKEYFITRDMKTFHPVLSNEQDSGSPVIDVVLLKVPQGTGTKLRAAPASTQCWCPNSSAVEVYAGGMAEGGEPVKSVGQVTSIEGPNGIFTLAHSASTDGGFSGAPLFQGNKVVGMHLASLQNQVNLGVWLWPILGEVKEVTPRGFGDFSQESGEFSLEHSEDGFAWMKDEPPFELSVRGDRAYVRTSDGRNYNYEATDHHLRLLRSKYSQFRKSYDDFIDYDQVERDSNYHTAVGKAWEVDEPDFDEVIQWENAKKMENESFLQWIKQQIDPKNLVWESKPRPMENLEPTHVLTGLRAFSRILHDANEAKVAMEMMCRTGNLNLARRDKEASFQQAADASLLADTMRVISTKLAEASDLFEQVVQKSDKDAAQSTNWANYRHKHRDDMPPPQAQTRAHVDRWLRNIETQLIVLRAVPKRQTPTSISQTAEPQVVQERLSDLSDMFETFGLNFEETEDGQDFRLGAPQKEDGAPDNQKAELSSQPSLCSEEQSSETIQKKKKVSWAPNLETPSETRNSRHQNTSRKPSQEKNNMGGPRKPRNPRRFEKRSNFTQESMMPPDNGVEELLKKVSMAALKPFFEATLRQLDNSQ
ncbi:hypothetical protein 1 [Beihai sobemo-like virus 17]|uniref:hypothetical protein 1 n=1 Tax=Beihai sobemo-like virus 17 TaxID=1922688 RepID=UPI00090C30C5|nr:hypothetical protein 1 [Beihai sobemo-like virus 17]APG75736.1 hypothetical protein 1 [Beihai sobemo-like virus 17]